MQLASRDPSNGTRLHPRAKSGGVDGRSMGARRFKALLRSFSEPLGGFDRLGEGDKALVRQAATLAMEGERLQAASVRGEPVDHDTLIRITNTIRRVQASLRLRKPEKLDDGLHGYLERKRAGL